MNQKITKRGLSALALGMGLMVSQQAFSANWLMLQGTEPTGSAKRATVWGFIQAQYQKDYSDAFVNPAGAELYVPPKLIGPSLDSQSQFNVNRARIGARGANLPLDSNTNYFILAEFGNNLITSTADYDGTESTAKYAPHLTDASITFNNIKQARIRVGMFKYPGAEEGMQAIHTFDYINFTNVTNQLTLERFPSAEDLNLAPQPEPGNSMNRFSLPAGAFRDTGVQVFSTFKVGDWEHSYAAMVGNGNGVNLGNSNGKFNGYLYWASERVFQGGKKARRQGWKFFAWGQKGERVNAYDTSQEQERTRYGVGTKYLKKPFRVTAEYMWGKGMIFQGQQRPQDMFNDLEADGGYIDIGFFIPKSKWEIDFRADTYTRGENQASSGPDDKTKYNTVTVGTQYHFNKKTHATLSYDFRNDSSETVAVNNQLEGVGNRLAVQVTSIY
jgi:hypothetical protein